MNVLDRVHGDYVFSRRTRILSDLLLQLLPSQGTVLDVGCGDGTIASLIMQQRPGLQLQGIDILVRPKPLIPVTKFDGRTIPLADKSVDAVMFVDVLHHANDPFVLLDEARRVARQMVVIKDHTRDGLLAESRLRFMDWVGNARHGVALPYNYFSTAQWRDAAQSHGLKVDQWLTDLRIYPWWADWIFGSSLHFTARFLT